MRMKRRRSGPGQRGERKESASRPLGPKDVPDMGQWGSFEELMGDSAFQKWSLREFSEGASEFTDPLARREFVKLMGASLALMGVSGCHRPPQQKIVPYLEQPELIVSGCPLFFATAMPFNRSATGILVESNEGRPTKIEGNSNHPLSLGATSIFEQAAILTLYDPDRSKTILHNGQIETWENLTSAWLTEKGRQLSQGGRTLRFLIDSTTSPTLTWQIGQLQKRYPAAKWYQWDPISHEAITEAYGSIFGKPVQPVFELSGADVIVAFDSDFLFDSPFRLAYTRAFTGRRNYQRTDFSNPNHLYMAEPSPTITGSMADRRLPIAGSCIIQLVQAIANKLGVGKSKVELDQPEARVWLDESVAQLQSSRERSLLVAGFRQPAPVHQWVHAINVALGNVGKTVSFREIPEPTLPLPSRGIGDLTRELASGEVETLVIIGGNPVFDAPVNLEFEKNLARAKFSLHLSLYEDETSARCHWHVPENHFLESWSDVIASDGSSSIIQPLIAPLYSGYSRHQLLALFLDQVAANDHDIVRDYWNSNGNWDDFEKQWRQALSDGVLPANSAPTISNVSAGNSPEPISQEAAEIGAIELSFHPDPTLWDGRFANNGWLQELPKPFTRLTWDNPALVSPALAQELQLNSGDIIEIRTETGTLDIPIWILPGQAKRTISLYLGGGRTRAGHVGDGAGFNSYRVRNSQSLWLVPRVAVRKTGAYHQLVSTQFHHGMQGRDPVRTRTWEEFTLQEVPKSEIAEKPEPDETLYNFSEMLTAEHQWGMVINLNTCIGCNACVVACQSENNIPVVGRDQVWHGREMHWIRIDHYYEGEPDSPKFYHQPVPCMHCETAPCELVCPVEATLHSAEGLNQQVYNRCIGTRYCSNNCPYKVRRFNFLQFADTKTPSVQLGWNPQVTVRSRGVMEKCSYCVQRIRAVEIDAEKANRQIKDGEIVPACAQVCPADAITFGDIMLKGSVVAELKSNPLNYGLLEELNTRPRTTYLAKVVGTSSEQKQQTQREEER